MGSAQCCSGVAKAEDGARLSKGRRPSIVPAIEPTKTVGFTDEWSEGGQGVSEAFAEAKDEKETEIVVPSMVDKGVYSGQTDGEGRKHGQGRYTYSDGSFYDGQWSHGKAHGNGTYWKKKVVYSGQWNEELKHGEGEEKFTDGTHFIGQFKQGYRYGDGSLSFPDSSTYEGQFINNNMEGHGTYKWAKSRHRYTGQWAENYLHGSGKYEWPDGSCYEGRYDMSAKSGEGTFYNKYGQAMDCISWEKGRASGATGFMSAYLKPKPSQWKQGIMLEWATRSEENTPREPELPAKNTQVDAAIATATI